MTTQLQLHRRRMAGMTAQVQFDAETERIQRQHAQPWPAIDTVREVMFRADPADAANVVISVVDGNGYITTRVRDAQAAIVEAAGYALRAGWNFSPCGELPDVFREGFLALVETMPAEVKR